MKRIISILTDFGTQDGYVAAMKGVILSLNPEAMIADITHEIPPQDVAAGAFVLDSTWRFFPKASIHLAVVDPGVGTDRKALIVEHEDATFIAPDNGLLTPVLEGAGIRAIREISNPEFRLSTVSATFHGRDIFAPAAAHRSLGALPELFGAGVAGACRIGQWRASLTGTGIEGRVIHVDRFGNAITNIRFGDIGKREVQAVTAGTVTINTLRTTYADVPVGTPLALIGSYGTVELSVRGGNFSAEHNLKPGTAVRVEWS